MRLVEFQHAKVPTKFHINPLQVVSVWVVVDNGLKLTRICMIDSTTYHTEMDLDSVVAKINQL